jgi:hypothetical protein
MGIYYMIMKKINAGIFKSISLKTIIKHQKILKHTTFQYLFILVVHPCSNRLISGGVS